MSHSGTRRIGFVGVGNMGRPMIQRLCAAGFTVTAYDNSAAALRTLNATVNCAIAESLTDVAAASDIVITMLPNGQIVRDVVLGTSDRDGLTAALPTGAVVVDMSSSAPAGTRMLGAELKRRGYQLVDAPVSGGVARAVDGTLAIFVGGDEEPAARVAPVLECMGSSIFRAGSLGAGHTIKALNNLLSATCFVATIEVLRIAEAAGIDPDVFATVVNQGSGSNNTTQRKLRQFVLSGTYDSGFSLALMVKDLRTAIDIADENDVSSPLSRASADMWAEGAAELAADADHTELAKLVHRPGHHSARNR